MKSKKDTPTIELKDVCKTYKSGETEVHALCGMSLKINKSELVSIMGPSGSGKSTLMYIMGCLDKATSGQYFLDGKDVSKLNDKELAHIRNQKIGFVFQSYNLLPRLKVIDNVVLPMVYGKLQNRENRALELLEKVGLKDKADRYPLQLSGGEQQRVAIARALTMHPSLILADEPTGNLDTKTGDAIMKIFEELHNQGNTVVLITHDPETSEWTERVIHIRDGKVEN